MRYQRAFVVIILFCSICLLTMPFDSSRCQTEGDEPATIDTIAGGLVDGNLAADLRLTELKNLTVDGAGNIYFTQTLSLFFVKEDGLLIRRIDKQTGQISTIAGLGALGRIGDTPALQAEFIRIKDLTVDHSGRFLFISENSRVRMMDLQTGSLTDYVGGDGSSPSNGDGSIATSVFLYPQQLQLDANNNLFLLDFFNRSLRVVDAKTNIINTVVGGGNIPLANSVGRLANEIELSLDIVNFAFDQQGNILLPTREKLYFINAQSRRVSEINFNKQGFNSFHFRDILIDANNNPLFVADIDNETRQVILKLTQNNELIIIAGNGRDGSLPDNIAANDVAFNSLNSLELAPNNSLITIDTKRDPANVSSLILRIDNKNLITTLAGGNKNNGDGGLAIKATFFKPQGIVVDNLGNIFISDTGNNRVRRIDVETGIITTIAGNGKAEFSGDGGPATQAGLNYPLSLAIDQKSNLFIVDFNNKRIRRVDVETGIITTVLGNPQGRSIYEIEGETDAGGIDIGFPRALTFDSKNRLFVSLFETIFQVDLTTARLSLIQARVSDINIYTSLAINRRNELIVANSRRFCGDSEEAGSVLEKYQLSDLSLTRLFSQGSDCIVYGVAVDSDDNIIYSNPDSNQIEKFDAVNNEQTVVAGIRQRGYSGDGGQASQARLSNSIAALTIDRFGNIYITDTDNNAIRVIKGFVKPIAIKINTAVFQQQRLRIIGSGYGGVGAKVFINDQDVSSRILVQRDNKIVLQGSKKSLGIVSGRNQILIQIGKSRSDIFHF